MTTEGYLAINPKIVEIAAITCGIILLLGLLKQQERDAIVWRNKLLKNVTTPDKFGEAADGFVIIKHVPVNDHIITDITAISNCNLFCSQRLEIESDETFGLNSFPFIRGQYIYPSSAKLFPYDDLPIISQTMYEGEDMKQKLSNLCIPRNRFWPNNRCVITTHSVKGVPLYFAGWKENGRLPQCAVGRHPYDAINKLGVGGDAVGSYVVVILWGLYVVVELTKLLFS